MRYPVRPGVPTENGWPMINANECVSVQVVPAAKKVPLRRGIVATILNAFIILYHREVEPITSQVWGWSPDNDVANSNHLSGTAIDINAPKYPWGKRVMPADRVAKVEALLRKFEGVVYWGRNWGRPDEMHFQIGLPPTDPRVKALADRLNAGYLGAYLATPPTPKEKEMTNDDLTKSIFDQLAGPNAHRQGTYPGWGQLGGRTIVDALAAIGEKLDIDGFKAKGR